MNNNNKNTYKTKLNYENLFDWCFNDEYILNSGYIFFGRNPYFQKLYEEDNKYKL